MCQEIKVLTCEEKNILEEFDRIRLKIVFL